MCFELLRCLLFIGFHSLVNEISNPDTKTGDYLKPLKFIQLYVPYQFLFHITLLLTFIVSIIILAFAISFRVTRHFLNNKAYVKYLEQLHLNFSSKGKQNNNFSDV